MTPRSVSDARGVTCVSGKDTDRGTGMIGGPRWWPQWAMTARSLVAFTLCASVALPGMTLGVSAAERGHGRAPYSGLHLYVAAVNRVIRFALDKDGLPATTPDWQLNWQGFSEAFAVALDGAGYIYVTDADSRKIDIFAPGSSGNARPVRTISIPGTRWSIVVTTSGYIFVNWGGGYSIRVYAPGAGDIGVTPALPLYSIQESFSIGDLVQDAAGRLYVIPTVGHEILVYNNPLSSWQSPDRTIGFEAPEVLLQSPMAVDPANGDVYFGVYLSRGFHRWYADDRAVRSITTLLPDRIAQTKVCTLSSGDPGEEDGMVVTKRYVVQSCTQPFELLVFRKEAGHQHPVETLPGGQQMVLAP